MARAFSSSFAAKVCRSLGRFMAQSHICLSMEGELWISSLATLIRSWSRSWALLKNGNDKNASFKRRHIVNEQANVIILILSNITCPHSYDIGAKKHKEIVSIYSFEHTKKRGGWLYILHYKANKEPMHAEHEAKAPRQWHKRAEFRKREFDNIPFKANKRRPPSR